VDAGSYHSPKAGFVNKSLKAMPPTGIRAFFEDLGLLTMADDEGRVFPRSQKAADVVNVLLNFITGKNVGIKVLTEVRGLKKTPAGFEVIARAVPPQWEKKAIPGPETVFSCDAVILAAGGPAYPQIGGSASGYELARSLGHTTAAPQPVLVPLKVKETFIKQIEGVRVQACAELRVNGKVLARRSGEVLFTSYGLSGPAILDVSRAAVFALRSGTVKCSLDLFPEYTVKSLNLMLNERRGKNCDRFWRDFICGLADERVLLLLSDLAKVGGDKLTGSVPEAVFGNFVRLLKNFEIEISGPLGWPEAMAAAGGVLASEVSPETFESTKLKGLFITGELLDVDADSGGYNLHFAWTSGLLAGRAASSGPR
jgi:hypothetical protein